MFFHFGFGCCLGIVNAKFGRLVRSEPNWSDGAEIAPPAGRFCWTSSFCRLTCSTGSGANWSTSSVGDSAMALFHDGGHGPEVAFPFRVSSESDCQRTSFDLSSREELLSGYGICNASVHRFTTLKNFKKICMESYDYDLGRVLTRYVAFDNVDKKNVLAIDQHRENRRDLPNMRVLYDEELHLLIIKVMVGMHHESAEGLIATVVTTKLITAGTDPFSLALCGGARCGTVGRRHKEADTSFRPRSRTSVSDWPTLAVEVGVSESLAQLQSDAFFWLTKSGGATRIVLIIKISLSSEEIKIEHWENVPRTRASRPSTPLYHPGIVHRLTLKKDVTYTGASLALPFRKVYDILPAGVGQNHNLELSAQDLNMFCH